MSEDYPEYDQYQGLVEYLLSRRLQESEVVGDARGLWVAVELVRL